MDVNISALWTSRLENMLWPFSFLFTLWSVLFMARMDAVKPGLDWIHWIVPVGLKVQRAFQTAGSVFLVSLCRAIWQRWDVVWKGHGQGQQSKDVFQQTLLLCIVHGLGSCLFIIWHIDTHALSSDKVHHAAEEKDWGRHTKKATQSHPLSLIYMPVLL